MGQFCLSYRSLTASLRLAGCVIALAMAIILPALRTSNFGPSYKPVEVRHVAARHEYLGLCDDCTDVRVEAVTAYPAPGPLSVIGSLSPAACSWRAAKHSMPPWPAPRHLRRLRVSSDPCGPPFFPVRA
ncbi:MAG TPA: hypothetical protein VMV27_03405 [Candidatus Binataceae bacterium]|nr:hypothetical protein [Candidatus Binataceae bacterium]